jgi:CRP-like cAMP-binding protein
MMNSGLSRLEPLLRKIELASRLADEDRDSLLSLPFRYELADAEQQLVREGANPKECCVLLSGYAFRHKVTQDGKRQILSFHVAGDILDLQHMKLSTADHSVDAMTAADIAWVSHYDLSQLLDRSPRIADALWRDALIDSSIFREWVLNVGRRDARSRLAHLLCEFAARREAAQLGDGDEFDLPMTQEHIADATGLTVVHVNRMLRALSSDGVITHQGRSLKVNSWARLRGIAGFDPTYLHMVDSMPDLQSPS